MSRPRLKLSSITTWLCAAAVCTCCLPAHAVQFINTSNAFYDQANAWAGGAVPTAGQSAEFTSTGALVLWADGTGNTTSSSLLVSNGDYTFTGCCGAVGIPFTHTATGIATITGGGTLRLGNVATEPMNLTAGSRLVVEGGGTLLARFGSDVTAVGLNLGTFNDGTATFQGSGTSLVLSDRISAGQNGATGILNFTEGSSGTFTSVFLTPSTNIGSASFLNVSGGSTVSAARTIVGNGTGANQTAEINVDGNGSRFTVRDAEILQIAEANAGTGSTSTINITNDGRFDTGTGTTTINPTGVVNLSSGQFNLNGNMVVNGGAFNRTGGNFNLGGVSVTASSNGQVNLTGSFEINEGAVFEFNSGADFTLESYLDLANGTLIADGAGTTINTNTASGTVLDWDYSASPVVTVRNNAAFTINSNAPLNLANNGTGLSTLNIETGGDFNSNSLVVGTGSQSSAVINLSGSGSTLVQSGASTLTVGTNSAGATGTGVINIGSGSAFTTGTGDATVRSTGTININSGGTFNANGNVVVDSGTINAQGFNINMNGNTLRASNGGQVNINGNHEIANDSTFEFISGADLNVNNFFDMRSGTLIVDGPGTAVNTNLTGSTTSDWGYNGTNVVTIRNQATYSIGNNARLDIGDSGNGSATLNIESDADFNANSIDLADGGATGTAIINVTGAGSTLTQNGASNITVGGTGTGSALITIADGGVVSLGTGTRTINSTGTIDVQSGGRLSVPSGGLAINGGTVIHRTGAAGPVAPVVADTVVSNGGLFDFEFGFAMLGATLTLESDGTYRNSAGTGWRNGSVVNINGGHYEQGSSFELESGSTLNLTSGSLVARDPMFDATTTVNHTGGLLAVNGGTMTRPAGLYVIEGTTDFATVQFRGAGTTDIDGDIVVREEAELLVMLGYTLTANNLRIRTGHLEIGNNASYSGGDIQIYGGSGTSTALVDGGSLNADANIGIGFTTDAGQLTLVDGGTLSAGVNIVVGAQGELRGDGTVAPTGEFINDGLVSPGMGGLIIDGNSNFRSTSTLEIELNNTTSFDQLLSIGNISLGGTLAVSLLGADPTLGDSFEIISTASRSGVFSAVNLPSIGGFAQLEVVYDNDSVTIVAAPLLDGDFNGDGTVDAADYTVWRDNLGSNNVWAADADLNGTVDAGDYAIWRANFGASIPPGSLASGAVPEPAAWGLLAVGLALLAATRHRSRS